MAYVTKYQIIFPNQNGESIRIDLKEDNYAGATITLDPVSVKHSYIPSSDDPFEPIYASQLSISVDITDDLSDMPDFTSIDDRKYHVIMYRNFPTNAEFYGWVLSDNVSLTFNTGRRILSFNCVDGLGMLNDILFPEALATSTNSFKTLLYYIYTSLASIAFPANLSIYAGVSYYSSGMTDRGTSASAEPFAQAYMPLSTIKDEDYKYISCLEILRNICKSFGARLQQARGAWYITAINQMADPLGFYYTEYSGAGAVLSSGRASYIAPQVAYVANTGSMYFQNASQNKLLLKGFNNIYGDVDIQYPDNSIFNWDLKASSGNDAEGWNEITGGGTSAVTIVNNADEKYATFTLVRGTGTRAEVANTSMGTIPINASIKFSMTFLQQILTGIRGKIQLQITSGATVYTFTSANRWELASTAYHQVPQFNGGDYINDYSFTTPPAPITGQLTFSYFIDAVTVSQVTIGNFKLQIVGTYRKLEVKATINATTQYTKRVDFLYGFYPDTVGDIVAKGVYSLLAGTPCTGWYRYGKAAESFIGLTELVIKQYVNTFRKNIININGELWLSTGFSGASPITFTDTDPTQISVSGKYYLVGSAQRDYQTNEISGTYLEITDTDITTTISSIYYFEGSESTITYNP